MPRRPRRPFSEKRKARINKLLGSKPKPKPKKKPKTQNV